MGGCKGGGGGERTIITVFGGDRAVLFFPDYQDAKRWSIVWCGVAVWIGFGFDFVKSVRFGSTPAGRAGKTGFRGG